MPIPKSEVVKIEVAEVPQEVQLSPEENEVFLWVCEHLDKAIRGQVRRDGDVARVCIQSIGINEAVWQKVGETYEKKEMGWKVSFEPKRVSAFVHTRLMIITLQ